MKKEFLDWPFFTPRHLELSDALDAWAGDTLPAIAAAHDAHGANAGNDGVDAACIALAGALGDAGWLRHASIDPGRSATDESAKLDVRALCLIRETLARHDALADFAFAMQGLGSGAISLFGSDMQRQRWLPDIRAGRCLAAFALSEPRSGSDVANMDLSAVRDGSGDGAGYVLNGEKTWISNGGIAGLYTVFARTGEAPGAKGISAFLVPADAPGLEIAERLQVSAPHPLARIRFNDCQLPADALLGEPGRGFAMAMAVLDVFRPTVGAAALGLARRALAETLNRVRERELFGAPLAELQMVQGHVADMVLAVDAAALLVYRAAWLKDERGGRVSREAAMAKLYATEQAQQVIDAAVQLHGGDGVRAGSVVERLYREVRALRIYEGASDVQKVIIARQTLAGG